MNEIERVDRELKNACAVHDDLHRQLDECISRHNAHAEADERLTQRFNSLSDTYERSGDARVIHDANALVPEINGLREKMNVERTTYGRLDPAHTDAKARMLDLAKQKDHLLSELKARHDYLKSQKSTKRERVVQHQDRATKVDVGRGFDRQTGQYTTDVLISNRDPSIDSHRHIVITEDTGDVIYDEERPDKK
jgi:chromosome segregation ATPase